MAQLLWGQLGDDTTRALPRWAVAETAVGRAVSSQKPAFSRLLSKISDFVTVWKCLSVCQRKVFHFCGNQTLEYTEFVS